MLRLRRYRVLLVCAFVITVLLYHVSKSSSSRWNHAPEIWNAKPPPLRDQQPGHDHDHDHDLDQQPKPERHGDTRPQKPPHRPAPTTPTTALAAAPPSPPTSLSTADSQPEPTREALGLKLPELHTSDGVKGGYSLPTKSPSVPDRQSPSNHHDFGKQDGSAGIHFADPPARYQDDDVATPTTVHWQKPTEWFPVPEESLILLPTGKPKSMPSVQFAFGEELPAAKEERERRLAKVKKEAQHAWSGYKKYAWTHDELTPVGKKYKDPFCGWAATLVDSLDTLWIMDLKAEFEEAVEVVKEIDFTTTPHRDQIPVFETTIRYLGGLLGAYDVAGGNSKYGVLLDKAVELAEILMSIFDTPNRMPLLYYSWQPQYNANPSRASTSAGVAELGTLSMEFTRLAQLTGKDKYYDAVARITDALEDLQNRENGTAIPGIFPEQLDASGCNRSAPLPSTLENSSEAAQSQEKADTELRRAAEAYGIYSNSSVDLNAGDSAANTGSGDDTESSRGLRKRDGRPTAAPAPFTAKGLPANWECVSQGLTGGGGWGKYSMGGSQDSAYEYFPKQYILLGGLEAKYRTMHEKVADAVKKYLLYRPMAEGDPDILFSAKATSSDGTIGTLAYDYEVTHLTCFLGGMFGLGGKLFDRPEDVEIGKKLAEGCVWAYEVMPTGIMPEYATAMPCVSPDDCLYNQTAWYEALDPNKASHDRDMERYHADLAEWEHRAEELKKKAVVPKPAERDQRHTEGEDIRKRDIGETGSKGTAAHETSSSFPQPRQKNSTSTPQSKQQGSLGSSDYTEGNQSESQRAVPAEKPVLPPKPQKPISHEEYVSQHVQNNHIPSGFVVLNDKRYLLRPEAIESVWYMYRITGDPAWQDKGWHMFEAVARASRTEAGHSALKDVTSTDSAGPGLDDSMESFWLAETLKYFYLLFAPPDVISLDEWVLNTEAHPFRRPI